MRLPHARAACTGPCGCSSCSCSLLSGSSPVPPRLACLCQSQLLYPALLVDYATSCVSSRRALYLVAVPSLSFALLFLPLPSLASPCLPFPSRPCLSLLLASFLISLAKASCCCTRSPPRKPVSRSSSTWQLAVQQGAAGCTATRGQKHRRDRRAKAHRGRKETGPLAVDTSERRCWIGARTGDSVSPSLSKWTN